MLSDQRLHPATLLFDVVRHLKNFAVPAVLVLLGASRSSGGPGGMFGRMPVGWEVWLLVPLVPAVVASVLRYVSFRLHYEADELVIRSGLLFRNERHIPFSRIQNLDAAQNLFHRLFDVVEVRVETGGGTAEEAKLSVLPRSAFDEMRRRVFEGRVAPAAPPAEAGSGAGVAEALPAPVAAGHTLLHLPLRELLLFGFLENKGMVLIGAGYGLLWESGWLSSMAGPVFGGAANYGRGFFRDLLGALVGGRPVPVGPILTALAGVILLLLVVRLTSMAWAFVRLYDFRLTRVLEDLRIEFGFFTRVTATVPLRRVQTISLSESPLQRWLGRASVRVETAGGTETAATRDREWLAPLARRDELARLLGEIVPGFDLDAVHWQPVHARAFRRAVKPPLIIAALVTAGSALTIGWGAVGVLMLMLVWAVLGARQHVLNLWWAEHPEVAVMRSGWLWRQTTIARMNKVQAVSMHESPFDRRAGMARVRVDTAGGSEFGHRVDIPYLDREAAAALAGRLSQQAASTAFRW